MRSGSRSRFLLCASFDFDELDAPLREDEEGARGTFEERVLSVPELDEAVPFVPFAAPLLIF